MKLVIDTNRIIAAFIKKGKTREILFDKRFEFITPSYAMSEVFRHKKEMMRKAGINEDEFVLLLDLIFGRIRIISSEKYRDKMGEAEGLISDKDDVSFLALAIIEEVDGIWSDDKHFLKQERVRVFTTRGIVGLLEKSWTCSEQFIVEITICLHTKME
jgi:predicted nucleic acid-binding protein